MQQQEPGLVSIERVVAFIVTPIAVAVSGTLSAAAVKWGFNVTPAEIETAFAMGGLTAGAAAWKWLHGRQLWERGKQDYEAAEHATGSLGLVHATMQDLEGLARNAAEKAAAAITSKPASGTGPPDPSIPPAADPAPAGQVQVAEQADAGAASGS